MRALSISLALFTAGLLAAAPAPVKKPNLLKNGSFEQGRKIGDYYSPGPGSGEVTHWVVTRDNVDIVVGYWKAADGTRSIDLHGSPGLGGIQQTFATTPGKSYTVTFSLAGNPDSTVQKKRMAVSAAKQSREFTFDATGKTRADPGWVRRAWRFTAAEKETTLEFCTQMTEDASCGPIIDDVSVTED